MHPRPGFNPWRGTCNNYALLITVKYIVTGENWQ